MNNFFEAYTDGSCDNLSKFHSGGSAYVVLSDGILIKEGSKGFLGTTNNRMELLAIISVVNFLPQKAKVLIHTDSQYSITALTYHPGKKAKNLDLIGLFHRIVRENKIDYSFKWVKGHNGDEWNEYVDNLAFTEYKRICSDYGISSKRDEQDDYHSLNTRRYGRL